MNLKTVERAFSEVLELQEDAQQRYLVQLHQRDPETHIARICGCG